MNLFTVFVGETAKARKGTATDRALRLLTCIDADFMSRCCSSGLASGEGLIEQVRDPRGRHPQGIARRAPGPDTDRNLADLLRAQAAGGTQPSPSLPAGKGPGGGDPRSHGRATAPALAPAGIRHGPPRFAGQVAAPPGGAGGLVRYFAYFARQRQTKEGDAMGMTRREQLRMAVEDVYGRMPVWLAPQLSAFEKSLELWIFDRCYFHDSVWTRLPALHRDYVAWCEQEGRDVPCSLSMFTEWIDLQGFLSVSFHLSMESCSIAKYAK